MKEISTEPREYQKAIYETARDNNTLVVLPTGLGKTLIALMLAVDRKKKFPLSKIVVLAPTRPLVEQHLKSFEKNLPELWCEMVLFTGSVNAQKRREMFNTAEIIFSTPQCVANDLRAGLYSMEEVSLLVIDECHRCLKNYDYTAVVDYYKRQGANQRVLGLTASPGHESGKIKEICKHMSIDEIEVRDRDSPDVREYLQKREFEKVEVLFPTEFQEIKVLLKRIYDSKVGELRKRNLLFGPANKITLLKLQGRLAGQVSGERNFNAMLGMSATASAIKIVHALELLETQTLSGLKDYLDGLIWQANQKKSKGVQKLVKMPEFNAARISLQGLLAKKMEHPKIEETAVLIEKELGKNENFKGIVFAQFRETGERIVERLNKINGIKAVSFVGQAKKGNTGLSQKEQKAIISKMNAGEVNVLVATSIGEEGLDIAEVSLVMFYEPIPSAIRKIQRAGRTARLAPGKLIILVTKDTRDVIAHWASTAREKKMYRVLGEVKEGLGKKDLGDFGGSGGGKKTLGDFE